ncbi:hypothetical protein T4E_2621 [Trichinella pseudospiralis]|uniref:Uncharacterized protein n=1 Tax=Trichinella pseudospiralis TaxID=6337 RepID=A0A0V0YMA3_TRIPS|nr:hypothetical protein T4E_2621 [Trichinella pseudospiralis]
MKEWKTVARLLKRRCNCTAPSTVGKGKGHLPAKRCQRLTCQAPLVDPCRRQLAIPYKPTSRKTIQSAKMNGKGRRTVGQQMSSSSRPDSEQRFQRLRKPALTTDNVQCNNAPLCKGQGNNWFRYDGRSLPTDGHQLMFDPAVGHLPALKVNWCPAPLLTMGVVRLDGKFPLDGAMLENSSISLTLSAPANSALGHALTVDYLQATCTLDQ